MTVWAAGTEQILVMNVSTMTTEQLELSDTDVPSAEHSEFIDRSVTELVTSRVADTEQILGTNVSTVTTEQSENRAMVLRETNQRDIPVYSIECAPERRQRVEMSNNQWLNRV